MSYDTEEQQVEKLKEWWSENGTPLIVGAVLGLAGFGGWKFWNEKQETYQAAASDLYVKVVDVLESEKKEGLEESAKAVKAQYPDSTYAVLSAFHLAKAAVDAGNLDQAIAELTWVIEKQPNNELTPVAKIRLARLFMQQDKAAEALPLVSVEEDSGYYSLASLVKGDALIALERKSEALEAYKVASADLEIVARHPTLQLKIDALSQSDTTIIEAGSTDTKATADAPTPQTEVDGTDSAADESVKADKKPETAEEEK